MKNKKISKILGMIALFLIAVFIFFNPYADSQNLHFAIILSQNINNFFANVGLRYEFSAQDTAAAIRFLEYLFFGIAVGVIKKRGSGGNSWLSDNIGDALFVGLAIAVSEMMHRKNNNVDEIYISFLLFIIGFGFVYLIGKIKTKKKRGFKYSSHKYDRRR